jgi:hypothetical protein
MPDCAPPLAALQTEVVVAIVTAAGGLVLAALTRLMSSISDRRQHQRELYSQAFAAVESWREMLYRVRRRDAGAEADRELINRFHDLQEEIDYFQGWMASESAYITRSYCRLVKTVKGALVEPINAAWAEPKRRKPAEGTKPGDFHPDFAEDVRDFLFDVRLQLSLFIVPARLILAWRNRKFLGGPDEQRP